MSFIDQWNAMPPEQAAAAVLPCCGSQAWARGLVSRRPLTTLPELLAASDSAWWSLPEADWRQAFDTHPRIGERHAATASSTSLTWSAGEQSRVADAGSGTTRQLAEGNRAYEEKFGRTYIVCATGKGAEEMLTILHRRMRNTPDAELREAAEQQREITHIRLRKWLAEKEAQAGS